MHKYRPAAIVLSCLLLLQAVGWAQEKKPKPERALPPRFSKDVKDLFSKDARDKLVGERPALGPGVGKKKPMIAASGASPTSSGTPETGSDEGGFAWSKLIAPETLEDEIKAHKALVEESVSTPGPFKGGSNREARVQFSTLAVMFAIIGEYDGRVRWQDNAPAIRELFAQAGFSCKVGTDQSYEQSKLRKQDLTDLIAGGSLANLKEAEKAANWEKVSNRPPLMKRMELSYDKRLKPWLSSKDSFEENNEKILHEAQILAAISEVIQREGFEYWDDETYLEYAKAMRDGAVEISEAVKTNSYDKANTASGNISKACSECHEGYRS